MLTGLAMFGVGFAVAGALVAASLGGTPPYWITVSIGLLGIGAVGVFSPRGIAEAARPPVWSRRGLQGITDTVGLPRVPVAVVFYALVAVGVIGNLLVPFVVRRG
jgi:hypothetical protein